MRFMPTVSVSALITLLAAAILTTSCANIVVNSDDSTPPHFVVEMPSARAFDAAYSDGAGEAIERVIDVSRPFNVSVDQDRRGIVLLITAVDSQSGIRLLRVSMNVSFRCSTSVLGGPVSRTAAAFFSEESLTPADRQVSYAWRRSADRSIQHALAAGPVLVLSSQTAQEHTVK